jgi:hypothetical protein
MEREEMTSNELVAIGLGIVCGGVLTLHNHWLIVMVGSFIVTTLALLAMR